MTRTTAAIRAVRRVRDRPAARRLAGDGGLAVISIRWVISSSGIGPALAARTGRTCGSGAAEGWGVAGGSGAAGRSGAAEGWGVAEGWGSRRGALGRGALGRADRPGLGLVALLPGASSCLVAVPERSAVT